MRINLVRYHHHIEFESALENVPKVIYEHWCKPGLLIEVLRYSFGFTLCSNIIFNLRTKCVGLKVIGIVNIMFTESVFFRITENSCGW